MASTIGVIADAIRRAFVRELAAASETAALLSRSAVPNSVAHSRATRGAEERDGEHEEHDDAERGVGGVVPGRACGEAAEEPSADDGSDAQSGTDHARPQPLHR